MACTERDAERVYQYMRETERADFYDYHITSHYHMLAPTYRQIARALDMSQRYVRECIEHLEKTGRAKKPDITTKRMQIGTLLYKDEDGAQRLLNVFAGWNCYAVLVDASGRIVEVFDKQDRFNHSFDTWTIPGGSWDPYISFKSWYGNTDWLEWQLNINDSAWPGEPMARILKNHGKNYVVKTYDKPI